jgi:omega-hydroxy-beta-dihydromenaquinone-9 sulfotransferase
MDSIFSRMGHLYRILRRNFGLKVVPIFIFCMWGMIRTVVAIGMALDHVFFPRLRKVKANRPIILVGNPRTGTTFLQRFLADNGFGSGMELFLMLYPSLLIQKLLRPFLPILEKFSPAKFHASKVHDTNLGSVETDDVAVPFRFLDGLFVYGFLLTFDEEDRLAWIDPKLRDTMSRDLGWLDKLWRRSLVLHKAEHNIVKLFSMALRLPQLQQRLPDARILYMARDPLSIIPSANSLMLGVLDKAFGFWSLPEPLRKRWLDRIYFAWVELLRRFHADWTSGAIDKSRVFIVRYDRMMADFEGLMDDMCKFLGVEMSPELQKTVAALGEKQRKYESEHKYNLEKYGLTEEQVRRDCAFFYETFLPPMTFPARTPATPPAENPAAKA